jgi:hypothetical protein
MPIAINAAPRSFMLSCPAHSGDRRTRRRAALYSLNALMDTFAPPAKRGFFSPVPCRGLLPRAGGSDLAASLTADRVGPENVSVFPTRDEGSESPHPAAVQPYCDHRRRSRESAGPAPESHPSRQRPGMRLAKRASIRRLTYPTLARIFRGGRSYDHRQSGPAVRKEALTGLSGYLKVAGLIGRTRPSRPPCWRRLGRRRVLCTCGRRSASMRIRFFGVPDRPARARSPQVGSSGDVRTALLRSGPWWCCRFATYPPNLMLIFRS